MQFDMLVTFGTTQFWPVFFYGAALMPDVNQLPQILHFADSDAFTFAIMPLGAILIYFVIGNYSKKMKPNDVSSSS